MRTSTGVQLLRASSLVLAIALVGCRQRVDEAATEDTSMTTALKVTEVTIGRTLEADNRITDATNEFKPTETIYASVETSGAATNANLVARWTFEDGQVIDETTQTISPTGPAVTTFHISKPSGWPTGKYRLEIFLNGTSVETEDFTVDD